jgi:hypothetical protein
VQLLEVAHAQPQLRLQGRDSALGLVLARGGARAGGLQTERHRGAGGLRPGLGRAEPARGPVDIAQAPGEIVVACEQILRLAFGTHASRGGDGAVPPFSLCKSPPV